jgi:hypothetical protein
MRSFYVRELSAINNKANAMRYQWTELAEHELPSWNERLLTTEAPLYQYPYWNESFRSMYFSPRYLVYGDNHQLVGYACVLTLGFYGVRIGLIHHAPVSLNSTTAIPVEAMNGLLLWAKQHGYMFLRVTPAHDAFLDAVSSLGLTQRTESFPFYKYPLEEMIVELDEDDAVMLSRFKRTVKQEFKKGVEAGYEITVHNSPDYFVSTVWPLLQKLSRRKGFSYRPLESFVRLLKLAEPLGLINIYTAHLDQKPVQSVVTARYGISAYGVVGALDIESIENKPSPACLLFLYFFRHLRQTGVKYFNIGTKSAGEVLTFKNKFNPADHIYPAPVTVIINPVFYRLWSATFLRLKKSSWRKIIKLFFR